MKIARKIVVIGATSGIAEHCCRLWAVEQPVEFVLVARDKAKLDKIAADLKAALTEFKATRFKAPAAAGQTALAGASA